MCTPPLMSPLVATADMEMVVMNVTELAATTMARASTAKQTSTLVQLQLLITNYVTKLLRYLNNVIKLVHSSLAYE